MDELFGDVFDRGLAPRRRGGFSPAVDVYYVGDPPRAVVRADLAGIDPAELELEIRGRELILGRPARAPTADRGAPLPAARDRARAVPARRRARRRGRRRRRQGRLRGRHARGRAAGRRARPTRAPCRSSPAAAGERRGRRRDHRHRDARRRRARRGDGRARRCPTQLPVLPLRDTVTFPDTLTPLAVGQERSIQLVNDVLARRPQLVMVGSRDPELESPAPGRALRRRRRRHRRAHAQGARRDAADPRPGRPARAHRGVGRRGALPRRAHLRGARHRRGGRRS